MYFLLTTGRIVSERDIKTAYEICNGSVPGTHPGHYEKWLHEIYGIIRSIPKNEISIEELVRGSCLLDAIKMYRLVHNCSLSEAKTVIYEMYNEKE